jgi:tetratricopeptide (TPR) repeat protein
MNTAVAPSPVRHAWLDCLVADPAQALDGLLRGVAHLPGLQRASPSEALMAVFGDLPQDAPEWSLLDGALLNWLQFRRANSDRLLNRPGGTERFIRETGEGLRAVWRLNPSDGCVLPQSVAWMRREVFELLRWVDGFAIDATFDLGRALLTAAAHMQEGKELRFLWLRICDEAALPRLRHRLDAALLGLASMPRGEAGGPSHDLIIGLARWASGMPQQDSAKGEVVREWRALKAAFPRQPSFWRGQWQAILDDQRIAPHPFTQWLREADPALQTTGKPGPRRAPTIPRDIPDQINGMRQEYRKDGLSPRLWRDMGALLDQLERYADATGEAYYLVTSCTSIASIIMDRSPGEALTLARRALLWAPSNGHAWSVRASALEALGRLDLAEAVLWEAQRRVPSNLAFYVQLAKILMGRGALTESEALLRKAMLSDPKEENVNKFPELARVLWLANRPEEAIALLRDFLSRNEGPVALYTLGSLLVAEGLVEDAAAVLQQYQRTYGSSPQIQTLQRRFAAGLAGQEEVRSQLGQPRHHEVSAVGASWDAAAAEHALAMERADFPRLQKISRVALADLQFRAGIADEALRLVDAAIAEDTSDAYAQVVKGIAIPEYRQAMRGRLGSFYNSLPVNLALSPENVGSDHWQELLWRFPEGQHLTHLVQLVRNSADETPRTRLSAWCDEPSRRDNAWESYLKETVRQYLQGDIDRLDLSSLVHDALTQAVDVGMDATPLAA